MSINFKGISNLIDAYHAMNFTSKVKETLDSDDNDDAKLVKFIDIVVNSNCDHLNKNEHIKELQGDIVATLEDLLQDRYDELTMLLGQKAEEL